MRDEFRGSNEEFRMKKRFAIRNSKSEILHLLLLSAVVIACGESPAPLTDTTDTRAPISVEYVRGAELRVHEKPDDASPVVTKYTVSEAVSILSKKGDWVEVRTVGGSGWARAAELATGSEMTAAAGTADNLTPRFLTPPEPVTQPGASGEIVLEADVSPNGDVLAVRLLRNTTGSGALGHRNLGSLEKAKFAPIIKRGQRMPFTYEHRVHY